MLSRIILSGVITALKSPGLLLALGILVCGHAGNSRAADPDHGAPGASPAPTSAPLSPGGEPDRVHPGDRKVVARVAGRDIAAGDVDASIRMQLHDLDLARYHLRLQQLKRLVAGQANGSADTDADLPGGAKILLEPPKPPRFEVGTGNNEIRGTPGAPVTIIEFLDYESPHCRRAQPLLHQLLEDYGPLLRLIVRDYPLAYHRNAWQAALAAGCARAQGKFWRYHDLLLQNQDRLAPSAFTAFATTLQLDGARFQSCMDNQAGAATLREDLNAARGLGLHSTPVFFINGLYHKGPAEYGDLARLINSELVRLGVLGEAVIRTSGFEQSPFTSARHSELPLDLRETGIRDNPLKSSAVLHHRLTGSTQTLKPGDTVAGSARLVLVTGDRAYLEDGNRLEFIPLSIPGSEATAAEAKRVDGGYVPDRKVDAVFTLHRADVDQALEKRNELESVLASGVLDVGGKRLMKLGEVEVGSFYDQLGLQARDVLMQVDGEWVHNLQNPLWDSLRTKRKVTLTIMRKGYPKTFQYVIEEAAD